MTLTISSMTFTNSSMSLTKSQMTLSFDVRIFGYPVSKWTGLRPARCSRSRTALVTEELTRL